MMSKFVVLLLLMVAAVAMLGAQNVLTNVYRDSVSIYIMLPVSQMYFSEETATAEYLVSINLFDAKQKNVYQNIRTVIFDRENADPNRVPVLVVTRDLASGRYRLIVGLQNKRLGDKAEKQYDILIPPKPATSITSFVIAGNAGLTFMPLGFEQLNQTMGFCDLILDTYAECDSLQLRAVISDTLRSFKIPRNSGYKYDLMPVISMGAVSWMELNFFSGNLIRQEQGLLYKSGDKYRSIYSIDDQLLQIKYIAGQNEWKTIKKLAIKDKESAVKYFWDQHSNSPNAGGNDFREMFYARVLKADELFTVHKKIPGWKSDRGRIFIIKGPPDDVVEDVFPIGVKPYIIWRYFNDNSVYRFVDKSGYGNYTLEAEENDF